MKIAKWLQIVVHAGKLTSDLIPVVWGSQSRVASRGDMMMMMKVTLSFVYQATDH